VLADAFGEKQARGDHVHAQFEDPPGDCGDEASGLVRLRERVELVKVITAERGDV
jgi:hypothetical protein